MLAVQIRWSFIVDEDYTLVRPGSRSNTARRFRLFPKFIATPTGRRGLRMSATAAYAKELDSPVLRTWVFAVGAMARQVWLRLLLARKIAATDKPDFVLCS